MTFSNVSFGDVTDNFDKKRIPLSAAQREKRQGKYRYYGAQGVIDWVDDYIFDGTYLLIAEDGENLKSKKSNIAQLASGKFWVNNHAHVIQCKKGYDIRYLCYLINLTDLSGYITGSAQPKLSQSSMNAIVLPMPKFEIQKEVADFIEKFDKKIQINEKVNDNLQQQASAIYQAWFEEFLLSGGSCPSTWKHGILADIANITSGKRPSVKFFEMTENAVIPIVGAASMMGYTSESNHTDKILVTGRVGTHGVIQRFSSPCWTSDNTLVITSDLYEYTYQLLKRIDYHSMNRGSTQPLITQSDMNKVPILIPDSETLNNFELLAGKLMEQYQSNLLESRKLAELRDTLLPKLISGEIDVSNLQL